jgi:hypothetical protein
VLVASLSSSTCWRRGRSCIRERLSRDRGQEGYGIDLDDRAPRDTCSLIRSSSMTYVVASDAEKFLTGLKDASVDLFLIDPP